MKFNTLQLESTAELERSLVEEICTASPKLLTLYPIASYIHLLDRATSFRGYRFVPTEIAEICAQIQKASSIYLLEQYHKLLLLTLIRSFGHRRTLARIPQCIESLILAEFRRIVAELKTNDKNYYLHSNDFFAKDLAICRLRLLPCGAKLVDNCAGVPRRVLIKDEPLQVLRGIFFFAFKTFGFRPFYEMHMDSRHRRDFHPAGVERTYLRIAELLELHPNVKGIFGTSWWYDPQLDEVSPGLRFLRALPESHGGRKFRIGTLDGQIEDAIGFSKHRRSLYESGGYLPTWYTMVWGRKDMLSWAAGRSLNSTSTGAQPSTPSIKVESKTFRS